MTSHEHDEILSCFDDVRAYIDRAHGMLQEGHYVALTELSPMVDALSARVLALPTPLEEPFLEALDSLSLSLNALKGQMREAQKRLGVEAKNLNQRQKAVRLYSVSAPNNPEGA